MAKIDSISLNSQLFASTVMVERQVAADGLIHNATVEAEYFDPKKCEAEDIAELCARRNEIALAVEARSMCSPAAPETAVYIIGPKSGPSKIGVAQDPLKRLEALQVSCWEELLIHGLFWFVEGPAFGVEALAHRIADKMGKRLKGEWVDVDPAGASYIVASVVHSAQVKVADSAMWLRQRHALMRLRRRVVVEVEPEAPKAGLRMSNLDTATITSGTVEPAATLKR